MRKLISKFISKVKSEDWEFDENIPTKSIIQIIIEKLVMYLRGFYHFHNFSYKIFIGNHVTLKNKQKFKFYGNLIIDKYCHIDALSTNGIKFGKNVSVGKFTTIECSGTLKKVGEGLYIGSNVGLGTHGFFGCAGGIYIGNDTIFGNFVSMHSENHIYSNIDVPIRLQGVKRLGISIGDNCWIGAKSTILDGVTIENGCIVAAGSVVAKGNYPPNSIIAGVPAKIIKNRVIDM